MIKIMILGSSWVGKTSLMLRYCENKYEYTYEASQGVDFRSKMLENTKLVIFDTPGNVGLREGSYGFYKTANAFILLFDLALPESLIELKEDIKMIMVKAQENVQLTLVGNKSDLERAISLQEAEQFANEYNIPYVEISCQNGQNVDLIFEDLLERVQISKNNQQQQDQAIQQEQYCCQVQ